MPNFCTCWMAWQKASGYSKRARAETGMACFKPVIGDGRSRRRFYVRQHVECRRTVRSHRDERRTAEVEVAVHVVARMLELGRPNSVRIA